MVTKRLGLSAAVSAAFGLALMGTGTANAGSVMLFFADAFNYTNANTYSLYAPDLLTASASGSDDSETVASSANLNGTLKILNEGVDVTSVTPNTASYASLGDTITSSGPTGGLNLGVNVTVDGSAAADNAASDSTFLEVAAYAPGVFDSNAYSTPLWAAGYALGTDSTVIPGSGGIAGIISADGVTSLAGSYGDGSETIAINIPFSSLPSTFDLFIALASYQSGTGLNWDNDYSHTLLVSLAAPNGVTFTSASGDLPGTVPEPSTWAMGGIALLAGIVVRSRKNSRAPYNKLDASFAPRTSDRAA